MRVVLASHNAHKLQEIQTMLHRYDMQLVLESELGLQLDVDENGASFEENSLIKARAVMQASGLPAIADDSGLVVDALDGAPGIYSARFGGDACHSDKERLELLLQKLDGVPQEKRTARFVCVITLCRPDGSVLAQRGTCEGRIAFAASGTDGFGYDPVFYVPEEGCTFAAMGQARKNAISHRANALKLFCEKLDEEKKHDDK